MIFSQLPHSLFTDQGVTGKLGLSTRSPSMWLKMREYGRRPHTHINVCAPLLEFNHSKQLSKCLVFYGYSQIIRCFFTYWTVCTLTLSTCSWLGLYTMWWRFVFVCIISLHNRVPRIHLEVKPFIFRMIGTLCMITCLVCITFTNWHIIAEALWRLLHHTNLENCVKLIYFTQ